MFKSVQSITQNVLLKSRKNSPQLLFAAGIVGAVGTVVLASRAGIKAKPVIDNHTRSREELEMFNESGELTNNKYQTEVASQYRRTGLQLVRIYIPVAVVGVASVAALTKSHNILETRNLALTATVASLDKTLKQYRSRVVSEYGEAKDRELLHGFIEEEIEVEGKSGKSKTELVRKADPEGSASPYSFYFNERISTWEKTPGYNLVFLQNQQKWANDQLKIKGYLYLNDVLRLLRIPETKEGQLLGWRYDTDEGDGYIDFGFEYEGNGEFIAGYEQSTYLNFNCDGNIWETM